MSHTAGRDQPPGPLLKLIQIQQEEQKLAQKELVRHISLLKDIRTGAASVSNAHLGKPESPLGGATLLSVLTRKDFKCFNGQVINRIGYPAHSGFQFVQEAYREGKWLGGKPQFKLPKAYRAARVDAVPMPCCKSEVHSDNDMRDASEYSGSSTSKPDIGD